MERELTAIDVHVHLHDEETALTYTNRHEQIAAYFGHGRDMVPVDQTAEQYRSRKMMAVIMNTTDATITGEEGVPDDHIAAVVEKRPDVFLGFGVIDPWKGKLAEQEIRRCKRELGLAGIGELNPARQHFFPHDRRLYPLWAAAEEEGLIVNFHGGYAGSGSGKPGGMGVKPRYSRPIYLDDVAADFPGYGSSAPTLVAMGG